MVVLYKARVLVARTVPPGDTKFLARLRLG